MLYQLTGLMMTLCYAFCYFPQIYKMLKTKRARDLSYGLMALSMCGSLFGFIHCAFSPDPVPWLMFSYGLSVVLAATVNILKFVYRHN